VVFAWAATLFFFLDFDAGLEELAQVVARGFHCDTALRVDPWMDPVREDPRFRAALAQAEKGREKAREAYERAGGVSLLGPGVAIRP